MADIHTLTSALNSIHQKLAMNVHLPRQKNSAIAIAEVRIDGPFGCAGDHRIKSIVALREEAIAVDVHGESMRQSHADAERELFRLRQQIATWAELLRRYLKEFAVLYQARQRELDEIRLPTPQASAAREELDRVFSRCLEAFCERIR
jgi:hypothetical protein